MISSEEWIIPYSGCRSIVCTYSVEKVSVGVTLARIALISR